MSWFEDKSNDLTSEEGFDAVTDVILANANLPETFGEKTKVNDRFRRWTLKQRMDMMIEKNLAWIGLGSLIVSDEERKFVENYVVDGHRFVMRRAKEQKAFSAEKTVQTIWHIPQLE